MNLLLFFREIGAVDISCGMRTWESRGIQLTCLRIWLTKRADKRLSARSSIPEKLQRSESANNGIRKTKQRGLAIISVKCVGHFSEVCRSFRWSLSIISVKFVDHFSEVSRSFQLFLSFISVVLWSSVSTCFRIFLLFSNLIKRHEKREKPGRDHFAGKKRQNKASKMSVYSTTTFLLMPLPHRTGNDYFSAHAMFTLLRCLQLTEKSL